MRTEPLSQARSLQLPGHRPHRTSREASRPASPEAPSTFRRLGGGRTSAPQLRGRRPLSLAQRLRGHGCGLRLRPRRRRRRAHLRRRCRHRGRRHAHLRRTCVPHQRSPHHRSPRHHRLVRREASAPKRLRRRRMLRRETRSRSLPAQPRRLQVQARPPQAQGHRCHRSRAHRPQAATMRPSSRHQQQPLRRSRRTVQIHRRLTHGPSGNPHRRRRRRPRRRPLVALANTTRIY